MKQSKIISAYKALVSLSDLKLPAINAWRLYRLKKALYDQYAFQTEQEKALIKETQATVQKDGSVLFASEDDRKKFLNRMGELANMEVDIEFEPVVLRFDDVPAISLNELDSLDGFIIIDAERG